MAPKPLNFPSLVPKSLSLSPGSSQTSLRAALGTHRDPIPSPDSKRRR